jgi:NhaP-type Na+/H+ or K+/H+ antiporter
LVVRNWEQAAFGFPLLTARLFGTVVYRTDSAAVRFLFEEFDLMKWLVVTVEDESLLDGGVTVLTDRIGRRRECQIPFVWEY